MKEQSIEHRKAAIESSVGILRPSDGYGACERDASNVITYLTKQKLCKSGIPLSMVASDFDSPSDLLTIYAKGQLTQVGYHVVAFMDGQFIVDLGRDAGNRVFLEADYISLIGRMQR